ncbi:hypothetical protein Emag_001315 [Eimeria magna]
MPKGCPGGTSPLGPPAPGWPPLGPPGKGGPPLARPPCCPCRGPPPAPAAVLASPSDWEAICTAACVAINAIRAVGPCSEVLLLTHAEACLAQKLSLSLAVSLGTGVAERERLPELREEIDPLLLCCEGGLSPAAAAAGAAAAACDGDGASLSRASRRLAGASWEGDRFLADFFLALASPPRRRLLLLMRPAVA